MSDTILGGDITVHYLDETRQKRMEWTGSATGTRSANEAYSAMGTLLDAADTGDDATAIFADTPVEYTVGLIDVNDGDPWYMAYDLMEHLTGGSFRTSGWDRTTGTDTGIVVVEVTLVTIASGDVGGNLTHADGDSGTLLEIIDDGTQAYLVIRPDSNAAANNFDTGSGTITMTVGSNTATQTATSVDGEQIWANYYNVTAIDADTHVYVYAGTVSDATRARVTSVNSTTQDYWPEGAFDRLIPIRDFKTAGNPLIDAGNKTFFARKANTLYDSFEVTASTVSGGRNPVPLKAQADANHTTGWQSITVSGGSGNFSVGDEIEDDVNGAKGIITLIENPGATATYHYYLIGDPQTNFDSNAITNNDDTGAATGSAAPANEGPALSTWFTSNTVPSVVHAFDTFDVDNDGTVEPYCAVLDCENNPLTEVYEWAQFYCQNRQVATGSTDVIEGEQYEGMVVFLDYGTSTVTGGTIAEGDDVTQETTGATGIVVSHDTSRNEIMLRNVRGTFATGSSTDHTVTSNDNSGAVEMETADSAVADTFTPNTAAPFGTFAGGRWFFARGVRPTQWITADENSWETQPNDFGIGGQTSKTRPIAIELSVSNLRGTAITDNTADKVDMHRLTGSGGAIEKDRYSSDGAAALAATSITVDTAISVDEPSTGHVNIRDESDNNAHYMIRYSSWATSTFTFASFNLVGGATAGTNTTTIVYATGGFNAGIQRGDIVWNTTRSAFAYVVTVDSDTQVTLDRAITGQTTADAIDFNVMPINDDTLDDVYPSLLFSYPLTDTASVSIVYDSPIFFRVKVSNTRHTTKQRRFVTDGSTSGTDQNTPNIVNVDSIHS